MAPLSPARHRARAAFSVRPGNGRQWRGTAAVLLGLVLALSGCATGATAPAPRANANPPSQTAPAGPEPLREEAPAATKAPARERENAIAPAKTVTPPKAAAVKTAKAREAHRPAPKAGKRPPRGEKPPFRYESLNVRNSCFVESVNFYDAYLRHYDGEVPWAQVLQWGNAEGDIKIGQGHAVTVYAAKGKLWFYDINFGVVPIDVPVERRGDLTDVGPRIFASYPQFRPVLARYREDYRQTPPEKRPEHLFYHKNADVRDATRVARELGRSRPTAVVEFDMKEKGKLTPSAAAVFVFGRRVCVYFPRGGTHVSPAFRGSGDDLRYIEYVVKRLHPGSRNVRWQPGGYLVFPPAQG